MSSIEESKTRWEFFQKHHWVSQEFSFSPIFKSWQRCIKKMNAYKWTKPHVASGFTLASLKKRNEKVVNCAITVVENVYDFLRHEKLLLLITDDNGCVMFTIGHTELSSKMELLGIKTGCFMSEDKLGTNAVNFTIDSNFPSEVFAGEHFKRDLHLFATAAAPIVETNGLLRGTILAVRYAEDYHREDLAIVSSCANQVSLLLHIQDEQKNMNHLQSAHNAVLDYIDDGVISWNQDGEINYANHRAEALLCTQDKTLLGCNILHVITFAPYIFKNIQQCKDIFRKQTTLEVHGFFVDVIITYTSISDGRNLLFLHQKGKEYESIKPQIVSNAGADFGHLQHFSKKIKHLIKTTRRAIKAKMPILITGEKGVGKRELAMAIHNESDYHLGPFIMIDGSTGSPIQLIRDVLGFEEGKGHPSKFELAKNGCIYIENVECLGPELQASLLHFIETGSICRSDSKNMIAVTCQLIMSTRTNLRELLGQDFFSHQLYYNISVNEVHIPPLRARKDDILLLISNLINNYETKHNISIEIDVEVMELLKSYSWPGNNQELRSVIERMLLSRDSNHLTTENIPDNIRFFSPQMSIDSEPILTLEQLERQAIIQAWKIFDGSMQDIAKALDIGRTTLWRKVKKYGIYSDLLAKP